QVANKTGGGGAVAAAYLAEKKGETHTIGLFTGVWLTNPLTSAEAKVSLKDLTPVARLVLEPALIAVKADAPYKTLADFVGAAKQKPGELKQSGGSITSRDNVVRQQLQKAGGARWQFISFPGGGERIAALLGGHVNMMVIEPAEAGEHIRAGNMRVLAQVADSRLPAFPNVPTLKEAGFNVTPVPQVRGVVAPASTSAPATCACSRRLPTHACRHSRTCPRSRKPASTSRRCRKCAVWSRRRAHPRRQHARARAGCRLTPAGIPERAHAQGSRLQRHAGAASARCGRAA